ncbi:hypothetical protein EYC80_005733 [Monilinia laxa]|uniref:Uncharacterized protein n=1 Tax=Monilinia laxa TaxID=61186 RepID=A0A5N6KET8_MONLA|nr:hypothetical protein EYC80_005733 [Monilinia laxa]
MSRYGWQLTNLFLSRFHVLKIDSNFPRKLQSSVSIFSRHQIQEWSAHNSKTFPISTTTLMLSHSIEREAFSPHLLEIESEPSTEVLPRLQSPLVRRLIKSSIRQISVHCWNILVLSSIATLRESRIIKSYLGIFRRCVASGEVSLLKISDMNSNLSLPRCQFIHALGLDKTLPWDQAYRQGLPLRRSTGNSSYQAVVWICLATLFVKIKSNVLGRLLTVFCTSCLSSSSSQALGLWPENIGFKLRSVSISICFTSSLFVILFIEYQQTIRISIQIKTTSPTPHFTNPKQKVNMSPCSCCTHAAAEGCSSTCSCCKDKVTSTDNLIASLHIISHISNLFTASHR